jgi:hypothetical protein
MALGDGIRRNIRTVCSQERGRFRAALLALKHRDWLDEYAIRQSTEEHRGPEFLPWHRELCNRFEHLLRDVDPDLSLHYWDWNEDPHELFTPAFMSGSGDAPYEGLVYGPAWAPQDSVILASPGFRRMSTLLESKHDAAFPVYFGDTLANAHIRPHDPCALLLHSNVDRLFAMWQAETGQAWRLDPEDVYGSEVAVLRTARIPPGSCERSASPWTPAESLQEKTCVHPAVVAPPCYDTLPIRITIDQSVNPGRVINFNDVYAGKTFARAASFQIAGRGNVHLAVTSGPTGPYAVITPGGTVTSRHSPDRYQQVRIWFGFTGGAPHTVAPAGTVTIHSRETGEDFVFRLQGNTIPLPAGSAPSFDEARARPEPAACARSTGVTWTWTWRAAGS